MPPTFCVVATSTPAFSAARAALTSRSASSRVPTLAGTWNELPPANSMPRLNPRIEKLRIAIRTRTPATPNQSLRRPTMLRPASPR